MDYNPGTVARMIGVKSRQTVVNWTKREELKHLFSDSTRRKGSPEFTQEDLFVANTIKILQDQGIKDWHEIAERIENGPLATDLSLAATEEEVGVAPRELYKQLITMQNELTLVAQRYEIAKKDLDELKSTFDQRLQEQVEQNRQFYEVQMTSLHKQITHLSFMLGAVRAKYDPEFDFNMFPNFETNQPVPPKGQGDQRPLDQYNSRDDETS